MKCFIIKTDDRIYFSIKKKNNRCKVSEKLKIIYVECKIRASMNPITNKDLKLAIDSLDEHFKTRVAYKVEIKRLEKMGFTNLIDALNKPEESIPHLWKQHNNGINSDRVLNKTIGRIITCIKKLTGNKYFPANKRSKWRSFRAALRKKKVDEFIKSLQK